MASVYENSAIRHPARLVMEQDGVAVARVRCYGDWVIQQSASLELQLQTLVWPAAGQLIFDCASLDALDTTGAWLLHKSLHTHRQRGLQVEMEGLKAEFSALLKLVASSAEQAKLTAAPAESLLTRIGRRSWLSLIGISGMLAFIGETAMVLLRSLLQPRRIRWRAVLHNLQSAGFDALPIVGLLSFLMGLVIAYQGADQLQRFGANIFIADLVGLSMLRELSPLLTAIIVAGRSGSAYAAQIGTMKVTEEIDALRTIGVGPTELLVLPKLLALVIALPLLTVYADAAGLLGGMIMANSRLDVGFTLFIDRLHQALHLSSFLTGVGKAPVFAAIIALVGCHQGFQVSGSADSVGRQTTVSVVHAIFLVILADSLFSIVFNWLKL
ncbi:MAG: ABC transporter permease [Gallionella sp.]|nr:ABC transporter permease [Gallionella sp.]MDD4946633.1 ABC transporter permease [Gallionella sp.]